MRAFVLYDCSLSFFIAPGFQTFVTISGTPVDEVLTFGPGLPMVVNISMRIIDDDIGLEPVEVFPLRFRNADPRVIVGGQGFFNMTRINIEDDDGKNIHIIIIIII